MANDPSACASHPQGLSWARFLPFLGGTSPVEVDMYRPSWGPAAQWQCRRRLLDLLTAADSPADPKRRRLDPTLSPRPPQPSPVVPDPSPAPATSLLPSIGASAQSGNVSERRWAGRDSLPASLVAFQLGTAAADQPLVALVVDYISETTFSRKALGEVWPMTNVSIKLLLADDSTLAPVSGSTAALAPPKAVTVTAELPIANDCVPEAVLAQLARLRIGAVVGLARVRSRLSASQRMELALGMHLKDLVVYERVIDAPLHLQPAVEQLQQRWALKAADAGHWPRPLGGKPLPLQAAVAAVAGNTYLGRVVAWEDIVRCSPGACVVQLRNLEDAPQPTESQLRALFPQCTVLGCHVAPLVLHECCRPAETWHLATVMMASEEDVIAAMRQGSVEWCGKSIAVEVRRTTSARDCRKLYLWDPSISPPDAPVELRRCAVLWLDTPWMRRALAAQLRLGAWVRIQKAKQATNLNIHMGGLTSVVVLPEEWGWLHSSSEEGQVSSGPGVTPASPALPLQPTPALPAPPTRPSPAPQPAPAGRGVGRDPWDRCQRHRPVSPVVFHFAGIPKLGPVRLQSKASLLPLPQCQAGAGPGPGCPVVMGTAPAPAPTRAIALRPADAAAALVAATEEAVVVVGLPASATVAAVAALLQPINTTAGGECVHPPVEWLGPGTAAVTLLSGRHAQQAGSVLTPLALDGCAVHLIHEPRAKHAVVMAAICASPHNVAQQTSVSSSSNETHRSESHLL